MNDIFHERHMNNIIAADREQNIHVRPTTSTRIGSRASGPRARGPTALARSRISLVYAACRLMHLKFLAVLRRTRGRTSTQNRAWSVSDRNGISPGSNFGVPPSTTQGEHAGCAANERRDHRNGLES
jgi:hypothetical protein